MLNGRLVFDSVIHGFDARPELRFGQDSYEYGWAVLEATYGFQEYVYDGAYRLEREAWFRRMTPDALGSVVFEESLTDVACFHTIPAWGIWPDLSPLEVGAAVRERYPGRVLLYGGVSPVQGEKAVDDLIQQREQYGIDAVKLYPVDIVDGQLRPWKMTDEVVRPVLDACRELKISVVAVHKAFPIGLSPTDVFRPDDVDVAAREYPDLNFEIVHGGFAFLEETAFQLARFSNVFVNLEATSALLLKNPGLFARAIGQLMLFGNPSQVLWGTGGGAFHPQPLLEAFDAFELPPRFRDEDGYPELTEQIKADILGGNAMRMHGIAPDVIAKDLASDGLDERRAAGLVDPWKASRAELARDTGASPV